MSSPRIYEEYEQLKTNVVQEITKENAHNIFLEVKKDFFRQLKLLNTDSITEVENLYLLIAKINCCLSFIWADKEHKKKNIAFEDALKKFATDEMFDELMNCFNKEIDQSYLYKIKEIDDKYKPAKQGFAALHSRVLVVYNGIKDNKNYKLSALVNEQLDLLEHKNASLKGFIELTLSDDVVILAQNIQHATEDYLIRQDENEFKNKVSVLTSTSNLSVTWQKIMDDIAKTILGFFSKDCAYNFSFFSNEEIKNNFKKIPSILGSDWNEDRAENGKNSSLL